MGIWNAVWDLLSVIVYAVLGTFALIFILALIARIVKFNKLKFKKDQIVKSELIKKKMFKTSDGYELRWFGEIDQKSEYIIIGIHDMFRNRKDFDKLELWLRKTHKDKYSLVSFDQRNCGENIVDNQYHFGTTISDLREIVEEIGEKYPSLKIILLGDGFGSTIASFLSQDEKIHSIICSSMRLNNVYKKTFGFYLKLWWGTLFKANARLALPLNGSDLTDDSNFAKVIEDENTTKNSMNTRDYYLWKKANKVSVKNINNSKSKFTLIMSNTDFYCNSKNTVKYISKLEKDKYNLETVKGFKHYFLNTKNSEQIFELIIKNI
ncbi:serine aminopeptidase domain-containing protein [Spiroplasma endosymbiont of Diplazon laetatorius]|uniref:serine aminopeptidase domain-containing protein n=1 Tax=Spiroplasma endosymbiont of Diplazon laetatorius TaxID=3066322 RepID=UPI0030D436BD